MRRSPREFPHMAGETSDTTLMFRELPMRWHNLHVSSLPAPVLHGDRDRAPRPPQVAQASFLIAVPISINATFDFKKGSKWDNTRPLYNSVAVAWTLH